MGADFLALDIAELAWASPGFGTGMARIDVGDQPVGDIDARAVCPDGFAGAGVVQACAGCLEASGGVLIFGDEEQFLSGAMRIEVAEIHGITVATAGGVESGSVIVDGHGVVDDFVAAIEVDVTYRERMSSHAGERGGIAERRVTDTGVEKPAVGQGVCSEIPGGEGRSPVDSAAHHQAGMLAIEVGHAGEEAVTAVAIAVVTAVAPDSTPAIDGFTRGEVIDGMEGGAGVSIEHGEVFGPLQDASVKAGGGILISPVGVRVSDGRSLAVGGSVGGLAGDFRAAVAVEVIDHELGVVFALADVASQVNSPEAGSIQFISIEDRLSGESGKGVIAGLAREHDYELVAPVAIEIPDRGITRAVISG
ncbi:MAG: hypothetical protein RI897_3691 [Verrucomicrobiota bacterium]